MIMIDFKMNMPFYYMVFYGSIMIIIVLLLRALLRNRLPKFAFPVLWSVILIRLLIPFSIGSPLSMKVPSFSFFPDASYFWETERLTVTADEAVVGDLAEDSPSVPAAEPQNAPAASSSDHESTVIEQAVAAGDGSFGFSYLSDFNNHGHVPYRVIVFLYFAGLAVTAGILFYHKFRCTVRLKDSLLVEHNETVNTLLREMDMGHILVFTNDEIASPLVCGLIAPKIYLPTRMNFDQTELLRHILSHETMHIRRGDNRLKFVMLIALCVHWFNPLVWIMSKYFSSDIEAACDEAVLRRYHNDEAKKSYALSLLTMAVTGNRQSLLYSAFSKTEVERRVRNVLRYKKASAFLLTLSACFVLCSSVVFATGGQAPFEPRLTSFLSSDACRFAVQVNVTRNVFLGNDSQHRAEQIIFNIMREDLSDDPDILDDLIRQALSEEFHVEPGAFEADFSLLLDEEELYAEYEKWGIVRANYPGDTESPNETGASNGSNSSNGTGLLYHGETIRRFSDEMPGHWQSQPGTVDVTVIRDRLGYITGITALHEGDAEYDRRTAEMEQHYWY